MLVDFDLIPMEASWHLLLHPEFEKPYMKNLKAFLSQEMASNTVYPPRELIFNALCHTPYDKVKVVIIGQDPYHGPSQAEGLCFSVPKNVPIPPSLQNIFKELHSDLGIPKPPHGSLVSWAKQGVLLLNATLTVRANVAKSHFGKGWETFTDKIVQILSEKVEPIVFLLWGRSAIDKYKHICDSNRNSNHLVLTAAHPSPLSAYAGFFGCRHFSRANQFLKEHNRTEIDWNVPP